MRKNPIATLLKSGNRLVIDPADRKIHDTVCPHLTFVAKRFLYGAERATSGERVELTNYDCFILDHRGRVSTSFGYYKRVTDVLKRAGYRVLIKDLTPHPNPGIFKPFWERVFGEHSNVELRHGQDEFLLKVLSHPCGRFDCPTGYGKSFLIGLIGKLLPKARIDVITRRVPVLRDRIYPELCQMLPDVGIVGGGRKRKGHRVMCYTSGSIQHAEGDADIMIGDECHELAADDAAYKLSKYDQSRNYGLSATHDMRLDGKDLRVEGIFGPLIFEVPYAEAVSHGMVVPIEVVWSDVVMDMDPCEDMSGVPKKRHGIWRNMYRNELIAKDARQYGDDTQVLITVETIEHAVFLKKHLPEFQLVHSEEGLSDMDRRFYVRRHLITDDEPRMTIERRAKLTKMFEKRRLKKAICTTVWNVGVDFKGLSVLIRADGGGSPINDIQIPGRTARIFDDKECAIVHDYKDQFNTGTRQKAKSRESTYEAMGWKQHFPGQSNGGSDKPQHSLWLDD